MSDIFIGIDPGSSGAIAAIDCDRNVLLAEFLPTIKTPKTPRRAKRKNKQTGEVEVKIIRGMKTEFDFLALADMFDKVMFMDGGKTAVIEDITAMPRDSVTAAFTFGGSFWALQMALADRAISYEKVKPKLWQGIMLDGIYHDDPKARRKAYLAKARIMFPATDLSLVKHAEVAAALLLAEYCRRLFVHSGGMAMIPIKEPPTNDVCDKAETIEVEEVPENDEIAEIDGIDMSVDDIPIDDEENEI